MAGAASSTKTVNLSNNGEVHDVTLAPGARDGKKGAPGEFTFRGEGRAYVYAVPVSPTKQAARIVEAGKFYGPTQEIVDKMALVLASGVTVAFLLSVVGALLLARKALSPVREVVTAAHRITDGDLSEKAAGTPLERRNRRISPPPLTICSLISKEP